MLDFFVGLKNKLLLVGAALLSVLFMWNRYQSKQIKELEHENKIHTVKDEMQEEESEFTVKLLADEQEEVLKMTKEVSESDEKITIDDLNNL